MPTMPQQPYVRDDASKIELTQRITVDPANQEQMLESIVSLVNLSLGNFRDQIRGDLQLLNKSMRADADKRDLELKALIVDTIRNQHAVPLSAVNVKTPARRKVSIS